MEKVTLEISPAPACRIRILEFPELFSENKLVRKSIDILRHYAPGILNYLSKQRVLSHLPSLAIEVHGIGNMAEADARALLASWMRRKRTRRLFYVVLELLLMPFTAFVALLPGPNIVFYGLFILFYFHAKAFLSLSRIKVEELNITIIRGA
jgi:hypothetical protein